MSEPSYVASHVYPSLTYDDAANAIEWLCRAFGFTKRLVIPTDDGQVRHSELSYGSVVVMVSSPRPDVGRVGRANRKEFSSELSLYVEDPDAHYERAKAAGAICAEPPMDTPFGARGYSATDPEGHVWFFANYRPGAYWSEGSPGNSEFPESNS